MPEQISKVAIIGCGLIAGGYDTGADAVHTHAGALKRLGIRIAACVEPDENRRIQFMQRWDVPVGLPQLTPQIASELAVDMASICTPTESHASNLALLLPSPAKAIFSEKPLALKLDEARRIERDYRGLGRPLAVNYSRRWNPRLRELARNCERGEFGRLLGVTGWYGKGIVHNGSHMIDLLRMLVGPLTPVSAFISVNDGRDDDPTLDAILLTAVGAPVRLIGTDYRKYDVFELRLMFSDAIVTLERGCSFVRIQPVEDTPGYRDHRRPGEGEFHELGAGGELINAYQNIDAFLAGREVLASDAASALAAQEVCVSLCEMTA